VLNSDGSVSKKNIIEHTENHKWELTNIGATMVENNILVSTWLLEVNIYIN